MADDFEKSGQAQWEQTAAVASVSGRKILHTAAHHHIHQVLHISYLMFFELDDPIMPLSSEKVQHKVRIIAPSVHR